MNFSEIVQSRYATKEFDGKKVPEETIQQLLELIRYVPTSFNIQPWKIIVVTDQKMKDELRKVSWDQPQVSTCSHLFVICANTQIEEHIDLLAQELGEKAQQYVQMMRSFAEGLQAESRVAWCQRQAYIALAHALLGAKSLGLDSCPMEGFDSEKYAQILNLDAHLKPTVLCPIGYAVDAPREKFRLSSEEMFQKV